jgi:hypothetical protein
MRSPLTLKRERRPKAALVSTNQLLVSSLRDDAERTPIPQGRDRTETEQNERAGLTFARTTLKNAWEAVSGRPDRYE